MGPLAYMFLDFAGVFIRAGFAIFFSVDFARFFFIQAGTVVFFVSLTATRYERDLFFFKKQTDLCRLNIKKYI